MNAAEVQVQICQDDEEIKALLVAHGKQTHLLPRPDCPGPFRNHVVWASGDGMIYAVTHYHGHLLPTDNGYVAIKILIDSNPPEVLSKIVRQFIEHGADKSRPYYYAGIVKDEVEGN